MGGGGGGGSPNNSQNVPWVNCGKTVSAKCLRDKPELGTVVVTIPDMLWKALAIACMA